MNNKVYVINYKETSIDDSMVMKVDCGTLQFGFSDFSEACKSLVDVAQRRVDLIDDDKEVEENWNDDRSYVRLSDKDGNTYEYSVFEVIITD